MGRAADKAAVAVGFQWIVVMAEKVCDDAGEFFVKGWYCSVTSYALPAPAGSGIWCS